MRRLTACAALLALAATATAQRAPRTLFDGATLAGWNVQPGDERWWRVEDGCLVGGSLDETVPHNTFLATDASFENFELRLLLRLEGSEGFVNSGVQVRSVRVEGSAEMSGYQVDAGDGWWGKLYDESRRNRPLTGPLDEAAALAAVKPGEWNEYVIRAEGPRLRSWINGVPAVDWTEPEADVPRDGHLGLQVHGGGKALLRVKDVTLTELPHSRYAPTWRRQRIAAASVAQGVAAPRTPAEELAGFDVLEGFEVELVASEPDVRKIVDVAFDDAGRLWAITACEYPLDGNESAAVADRYREGGRDQVLVFDEPWRAGPLVPRVFADGLFMPMALLPDRGGVILGQGPEVLRLDDTDGDGRADAREVLLSGFGIQDSHLMPHRFVRAPGGWVYLAQGAFNASQVRALDGSVTRFDKCKIGRFQRDGSRFEVVGVGLNNVWGFVLDRHGDTWIQEANDLGYALTPFEHGRSYPGIGMERAYPWSPWAPPTTELRLGGTGLSGLARSDDRDGFPAPWNETFFVANPILSAVQSLRVERHRGSARLEVTRAPDLLVSEDKSFRPVAVHFGPDGCLYVVDWYNPIISHNEVARDHPARDKTRSRIWRIRHAVQERRAPVDVAAASDDALVTSLRSPRTLTSRAAWHQIVDRGAVALAPRLRALALDTHGRVEERLAALWCLDELGRVDDVLIDALVRDAYYEVRREGARLAAGSANPAALLQRAAAGDDPLVRATAIRSLAAAPFTRRTALLLLDFVRPRLDGPSVRSAQLGEDVLTGDAAQVAFERSLVRAVLAAHPDEFVVLLDDPEFADVSAEARAFAYLVVGGREGALRLAPLCDGAHRAPSVEELELLASFADEPEVRVRLQALLAFPATRAEAVERLLAARAAWSDATLAHSVAEAARRADAAAPDEPSRVLRAARELGLAELEPDVRARLERGRDTAACLAALRELGCADGALYARLAAAALPGSETRRLAAGALAGLDDDAAFAALVELWPALEPAARAAALAELLRTRAGATRLVAALVAADVADDFVDATVLARLDEQLGDDAALAALRVRVAARLVPVLRLSGGGDDYARTQLELAGAFTVEAWVRLDPGLSNADGILAKPGEFDLNFHDAHPRLWLGPRGDVLVSRRRVEAETWTHVALVRDAAGELALYLDGELDATASLGDVPTHAGLDVGRTNPPAGCAARLAEVRVWRTARSAAEIGASFRTRVTSDRRPADLVLLLPGDDVELSGAARVEGALDAPPVLTDAERAAEEALFARYRELAARAGDATHGREVFRATCAACHKVGGEGGAIGPVLDGVGAKGREGLLRAILTPSAGVESGYRTLVVRTTGGELLDGFLAAEDDEAIVLRRKDREDLRLPRAEIASARFDRLSLMPAGQLEALADADAVDLLSFLQSLR